MTDDEMLEALRGGLTVSNPGSRGLYHLTLNPGCQRLRVTTAAGLTMLQMADVLGISVAEGQSIFALNRGKRFEEGLYDSGGAKLLDLYRRDRGWDPADCRVLDLRDVGSMPGGNSPKAVETRAVTQARRLAKTEQALARKATGAPDAYNILIQPVLSVTVVGVPYIVVPDLMTAPSSDPFYTTGEGKSFPHRGSKTDTADVTAATRQAGVGAVGLRQWAARFGLNPAIVPEVADLIFAVPGGLTPTLTRQSVHPEIVALERALAMAPTTMREVAADLPPGASLGDPDTFLALPPNYGATCKSFCPLVGFCKAEAVGAGNPALLGTHLADAFAGIVNLGRAADLVFGGAAPTPEEAASAARLIADFERYRRAMES